MKLMTNLDELIPRYAQNKAEMDSYKKICDSENAQIKALMADLDDPVYEAGGYKATYSVQERESMNENVLLEILKHNTGNNSVVLSSPDFGIVKLKEYIDFDALEKAIYDGKISDDVLLEMNKAKEVKEVVTLRVTKIKKKREDKDD